MSNPFLNDFLRFDQTSKFCFFDFETEGLNLMYSRPWQQAIMMVEGDDIKERHNIYIYWGDLKISAQAAKITGYDAAKVKRLGINPTKALDILEEKFEEADFIIGHNVIFYDHYIYRAWCKRLGRKPIDIRPKLLDTFLLAKAIKLGIPFKPEVDRFSFFMKLYSETQRKLRLKLSVLAEEMGANIDKSRLHDADYDLEINVHVWNKLKWNIPV